MFKAVNFGEQLVMVDREVRKTHWRIIPMTIFSHYWKVLIIRTDFVCILWETQLKREFMEMIQNLTLLPTLYKYAHMLFLFRFDNNSHSDHLFPMNILSSSHRHTLVILLSFSRHSFHTCLDFYVTNHRCYYIQRCTFEEIVLKIICVYFKLSLNF